jgi:hypothetical protein
MKKLYGSKKQKWIKIWKLIVYSKKKVYLCWRNKNKTMIYKIIFTIQEKKGPSQR